MKTCNKCNQTKELSEFYARQGKCKECCKKAAIEKYYDPIEGPKIKEAQRQRYERQKESILAYHKERNKDPEVNAQKVKYLREYRQREEVKEKEAEKAQTSEYKLKALEKAQRRRANKLSANDNTITEEYLNSLRKAQDYCCFYCGKDLTNPGHRELHLDHYIPLSKGGMHSIGNIVYACNLCNLRKGSTIPDEPLTFSI